MSMKILMVTNTYAPHVGGVARSIESFADRYREWDHQVLIVAPSFAGSEATGRVLRVPAIEHFRESDFSFPLPIPSGVHQAINEFDPDVVHSHHPFLLGDTALRVGSELGIPVVFTHHTQYDKYTHHLGAERSRLASQFICDLDVGYCNLCDAVVAPSKSIADDLRDRDVTTPIEVIPTGVDVQWWIGGSRDAARQEFGIPHDAFVVGHVGRLATEKNIPFLAEAVAAFLESRPDAWFVVGGVGPCEIDILSACERHHVTDRLLAYGILGPTQLRDLYHAMDVFAFASKSETQGIVIAEAMASGTPVVSIDAPGVREIVDDRINGRLLKEESVECFVGGLRWVADLDAANRASMATELSQTAMAYSIDASVSKMLDVYDWSIKVKNAMSPSQLSDWGSRVARAEKEFQIWGNFAHAIGDSVAKTVARGKVF